MSNPIADTADYFARSNHYNAKPDQQHNKNVPVYNAASYDNNIASEPYNQNNTINNITGSEEAHPQWFKVFNRLSFLKPLDMSPFTSERHEQQEFSDDEESVLINDTFELIRNVVAKDDPSNRQRQSTPSPRRQNSNVLFTPRSSFRFHQREGRNPTDDPIKDEEEEEKLPSIYDIEHAHSHTVFDDTQPNHNVATQYYGRSTNFFTQPFQKDQQIHPATVRYRTTDANTIAISDTLKPPQPIQSPSVHSTRRHHYDITATLSPSSIQQVPLTGDIHEFEDARTIKDKWEKTLERIKFITNNLQSSSPAVPGIDAAVFPAQYDLLPTLAPYYQPIFDPLYMAFTKDEYGKKPPPILLQCIYVTVTDSEYLISSSQWVFRVELQYGDVQWVIRRSIADFVSLHIKLKVKSNLYDYVPDPPAFPDQLANFLDTAKNTIGSIYRSFDEEPVAGPTFQQRLSMYNTHRQGQNGDQQYFTNSNNGREKAAAVNRRKALTKYLRALLFRAHVTASYDICEFLELSALSIVKDMGWKGKEGYMSSRINYVSPRCCQLWRTQRWKTEWIILRDSYLAFCADTASPSLTDVLLFDKGFRIDIQEPRVYLGSYHVTIGNTSRKIEIKITKREVEEWLDSLEKVQAESPWTHNHRFGSFAPVRLNAKVKWFVDAENHFNAVAEAILSAKEEIYIADWWLTPELYLRRPPEKNEEFRLDRLLKRKASEGVKIYIIVYKEMSLALTINSVHTKQWLQSLHPNIQVQRHPDHRLPKDNSVLFWSHHEKIVVIDNRLAFIGGLDLCFGRYDTHNHSLSDYPAEGHELEHFPGQDYSNPRVKDFVDVAQFNKTLIDRSSVPRMPWHDVTLGAVGPIARDIARHFIQRWNFLKSTKSMHRRNLPFLRPKGEYIAARDENNFSGTCRVQLLRSSSRWSSDVEREHSIYNAYMECITHSKHYVYIENQFFISTTQDDKLLRNKIAQAIVERIKKADEKKETFRVFVILPLVPAFEGDLSSNDASSARTVMHFQYATICRGENSIVEKLAKQGIDADKYISWFSLRKHGKIKTPKCDSNSDNKRNKSNSAAQQSFPSTTAITTAKQVDIITKNENAAAATDTNIETIELLSDNKNPFNDQQNLGLSRLHTNISAASENSTMTAPYYTPKRRGSSQTASSSLTFDDDRLSYVTELLYIHDKLMIVDDRIVLMGSANINDRSQLGNRDSEIAMIVEDTEMITTVMDGKEYKAAKFAYTLRMQLWREHLGLLDTKKWSDFLELNATVDEPLLHNENTTDDTIYNSHIVVEDPSANHRRTAAVNIDDIAVIEAAEPVKMLDRNSRIPSYNDTFKKQKEHTKPSLDAVALDPVSDRTYYQTWLNRASSNTLIYRRLFQCVPDDTVQTYEQHRRFMLGPNDTRIKYGHVADTNLAEEEICQQLAKIEGHVVLFPKNYLKEENLLAGTIIDTMTPLVIFT
ncbi:hypothetical protein BDF20DRAFT_845541 [Mycotypha africana]|uniref:uncharacterized protein n=1 Tax=Mycotypha africana TaxID=64632 RepID=UPI0023005619|nr:uncharacterized protein BDF20DRAFT_845541 [Mycotypha africana]KAI8991608.1 hypothetical protein BDF20DRAFT_845541 [Mycotypha africana]